MATGTLISRSRSVGLMSAGLAMLASALSAKAAVTAVAPVPSSSMVSLSQATTVSVYWNVTTNTAGPITITSSSGEFRSAGGVLFGTVSQPLQIALTGPATQGVSETVLVPADVVVRAQRSGASELRYRRSFSDGVALNGEIVLNIGTSAGSGFGINRMTTSFRGGKTSVIGGRTERLRAYVELGHTGSGLVRGVWEVAGPDPDRSPKWRTLATVSQSLAGSVEGTLESPVLPTTTIGLYLLRLRITEPAVTLDAPVIRYTVQQEKR